LRISSSEGSPDVMGYPGLHNEADYCNECEDWHAGRCPRRPRLVWAVVIYAVAICGIFVAAAHLAGKL
jgi:hypothetical protein